MVDNEKMVGSVVTELPHVTDVGYELYTPKRTPSKWVPFIFEFDLCIYYNNYLVDGTLVLSK